MKFATSAVILAWLTVMQLSAASILIEPANLLTTPGSTFSLDVNAEGVADLYAFQFDISVTPGLLSATSIAEGDFLASNGGSVFFIPGTIDNTAGTVLFTAGTIIGTTSGVNGSGTLGTINFSALSTGVSPITAANVTLLNSNLDAISATETNGLVTIEASGVPEPVHGVLFAALFIAGLQLFRRFDFTRTE